jgi:hypothetical protein
MPGAQAPQWRFLITPRWIGWHLFTVAAVIGMLWLGDWQLHRALSGNGLSWAYTFEWPIFAVMGVVFWIKTIRDEFHPPPAPEPGESDVALPAGAYSAAAGAAAAPGTTTAAGAASEEDADLVAYNAYLARLHKEVQGHGRWHGLR